MNSIIQPNQKTFLISFFYLLFFFLGKRKIKNAPEDYVYGNSAKSSWTRDWWSEAVYKFRSQQPKKGKEIEHHLRSTVFVPMD